MAYMAFYPLFLLWLPLFLLLLLPLLHILYILSVFLLKQKETNLPPGPPKLPSIGNLHQLGKVPHRSLWKLSQKYGPVMLLQLGRVPTLIVSSPEMAKEVLKTHDLKCCSRPVMEGPRRLSYNFLDIASGPYSDYWREIRKIWVTEVFSTKRVRSFRFVREEEVGHLINSLSQASSNAVNLCEKVFSLLDAIICKTTCGRSYEGKQFGNGKHEDAINEAMAMLGSFSAEDFFPSVGWVVDVFTGLYARREKCFRDFDAFYQRVLDEHLDPARSKPEHEDIIDVLLGFSRDHTGSSTRLTNDHIKAVVMNIFLGGKDTSALTIVWAMTELARDRRVMKKVQAEIRSCVGKKAMVEERDIENLGYLKMVVKETLRLHPPSVLLIPHQTMVHCKIGGYEVYPNTRIHVNAWAIGRDPKTWENPEEFYPERFTNSAIDFKGQHFELVPFGAGRRICPALTMGTTTLEFMLANLLYCFDWELPSGMTEEDISIEEEVGITVHKKSPLYLVPIKYNRQG